MAKSVNLQTETVREAASQERRQGLKLLRIYVALIACLVIVYFILHIVIRPGEFGPRDDALTAISQAETTLAASGVDSATVDSQLAGLRQTLSETLNLEGEQIVEVDSLLNDAGETLTGIALDSQKSQFAAVVEQLKARIDALEDADEELPNLIEQIEAESGKEKLNTDVLLVHLAEVRDRVARSKSSDVPFWSSGVLKWLELFMWALLGSLLYALCEIQKWLKAEPIGEFRKQTSWYIYSTIRGPFVALLVLFALSGITGAVDISVRLEEASILAWIFLAGTLGIFNRVAWEQLSMIVKGIFAKAWAKARGLSITPMIGNIAFGKTEFFALDTGEAVQWDVIPRGMGDIDAEGKYTAPAKGEEATVGGQVTVRATLKSDPSLSAMVDLRLYEEFSIQGAESTAFGDRSAYSVEPPQEGGVVWSIEPQYGEISPDGVYTAPAPTPKLSVGTTVTIIATRKEKPRVSRTKIISLAKGSAPKDEQPPV